MPVFKIYFRVIRKSLPSILLYLIIFLAIAVMATNFYKPADVASFQATSAKIAIINRDTDSALVNGLKEYLGKGNTLVDLPDDSERMQDEIFYRNIDYIAIIPAGFSAGFEKNTNESPALDKVIVPDSTSARYVDIMVDKYFNTTRQYLAFSGLTPEQRVSAVADDLSRETPVTVNTFNTSAVSNDDSFNYLYYFTYLSYVLVAIIILGISTIMMVFNHSDLRRRNLCSPIRQRSVNFQLVLGSVVFSLMCWALVIVCGFLLYGQRLVGSNLLFYCGLNSFVFTIVCVSIGFLVGILIKSYNAQAAIANVLSLGMSFLCGVFVPQSLMDKTVLRFASFLPTYWYVKATDAIKSLTDINVSTLTPLFTDMLIQLGFAVAVFAVALLISKQKRTSNQ